MGDAESFPEGEAGAAEIVTIGEDPKVPIRRPPAVFYAGAVPLIRNNPEVAANTGILAIPRFLRAAGQLRHAKTELFAWPS